MEENYKFRTVSEVVEELLSLPEGDSVDFTFDTPEDVLNDAFEPSGWYGVKIVKFFDEPFGVLCFGAYGGGYSAKVEEIMEPKEIPDILQRFCNDETGVSVKQLCVSTKHNGK